MVRQRILLKENEMLVTPSGFYIHSKISKQFAATYKGERFWLLLSEDKKCLKKIPLYIRKQNPDVEFSLSKMTLQGDGKSYYTTKKACRISNSKHYILEVGTHIEEANIVYYAISPIQESRI